MSAKERRHCRQECLNTDMIFERDQKTSSTPKIMTLKKISGSSYCRLDCLPRLNENIMRIGYAASRRWTQPGSTTRVTNMVTICMVRSRNPFRIQSLMSYNYIFSLSWHKYLNLLVCHCVCRAFFRHSFFCYLGSWYT